MRSPNITWISSDDPPDAFPDVESAFDVPEGLLAAGGDLSPARLLYAYRHGIFPWYSDGQPILWWSPDPRCVLRPDDYHVSRRLRRDFSKSGFEITFNREFNAIVQACAEDRSGQQGTWITPDMMHAYADLHRDGWSHSVEVWNNGTLVGGMYGLSIGRAFFGESMFSRQSNGSKAALLALCRCLVENRFAILDCQVESPHLISLGATLLPRPQFTDLLKVACESQDSFRAWPTEARPIAEFLA
jgi:leucyl/phenylalanyl-tRNA--protein transferase